MNTPITPTGPKPAAAKQVLYVDVDDEITTIIDKVNASPAKVVALVLPKRASVFQSVVNMKLLKRRADSAKKHIVLITSEASLMPLAGIAGVHVAQTLQSKPQIPRTEPLQDSDEDVTEDAGELPADDFDTAGNASVPVGALAGGAAGASVAAGQLPLANADDEDDVIELDNTTKDTPAAAPGKTTAGAVATAAATKAGKPVKLAKDRKLKVPNFFSFRKRLVLLALVLIAAGVGWYYAMVVMPKASVTIITSASDIDTKLSLTLDTGANKVDQAKLIVPAQTKQEQKSNTGQASASGQDNKGEKATGTITLAIPCAKISGAPPEIPAGTGVSAKGMTFITQKTVDLSKPSFSGGCKFTADTTVIAQKPGVGYNIAAASFTVATDASGVTASSSDAMSGGTDNIVKVVQQSDIDAARQKVTAATDQNAIKQQLVDRLQQDSLYPMQATFYASQPNENISSAVGDEAETVTVTQSVTYTMFGVKKDDLKSVIDASVRTKINTAHQDILDDGLDKARLTVGTPSAGPQQPADIMVTATAGPKIDVASLKQQLVGLKDGNVKDRIKQIEGVEDVQVKYSPFWVTKAPKADKITIQFEKAAAKGTTNGG